MQGERSPRAWIRGPFSDIAVFGLSWLPVYLLAVGYSWYQGEPLCDATNIFECSAPLLAMVTFANFVIRLHRHYTVSIVYADSAEFQKRRGLYLWLPVALFVLIAPLAAYNLFDNPVRRVLFSGLSFITGVVAVWTIVHAILQKYGMLRAYAAKLGYGDPRLDKRVLFSWAATVAAVLGGRYAAQAPELVSYYNGIDISWAEPALELAPYLALPVLPFALYYSYRWIRLEKEHYSPRSVPRLVFAGCTLLMLFSFLYSVVIGYAAAQINHSIEYMLFVNFYALKKPGLRAWGRHPVLANLLILGFVLGFYPILRAEPTLGTGLFLGYTAHNAFMHFVYDSYLCLLHDKPVRELVAQLA